MAKSPNTFAKRQREIQKKRRAEEKRAKRRDRQARKGGPEDAPPEQDSPLDVLHPLPGTEDLADLDPPSPVDSKETTDA